MPVCAAWNWARSSVPRASRTPASWRRFSRPTSPPSEHRVPNSLRATGRADRVGPRIPGSVQPLVPDVTSARAGPVASGRETIADMSRVRGLTEGRAFLVWRRGGKTPGRGETVAAATVDEKRLGRNRWSDARLWGWHRRWRSAADAGVVQDGGKHGMDERRRVVGGGDGSRNAVGIRSSHRDHAVRRTRFPRRDSRACGEDGGSNPGHHDVSCLVGRLGAPTRRSTTSMWPL